MAVPPGAVKSEVTADAGTTQKCELSSDAGAPPPAPASGNAEKAAETRGPVTIEQAELSRGDKLWLSIPNWPAGDPKPKKVKVRIEQNGCYHDLAAKYHPPAGGSAGRVEACLEPSAKTPLALGKYRVSARLDDTPFVASRPLTIVPVGNPELQLKELKPEMITVAFFEDGNTQPVCDAGAAAVAVQQAPSRVANFTLLGSFLTDSVADNVIIINGVPQGVTGESGKCEGADDGTARNPVSRQIMAFAKSREELLLCGVPVEPDSELRVAVRWGERVSETRTFRILSFWRHWVVVLVSALIALLLPLPFLWGILQSREIGPSKTKCKFRMSFIDAETGTYSLSSLQFYLWTVGALFGYVYLFISRVFVQHADWPDVPGASLVIIVVSTGTVVGAQFITSSKGSNGAVAPRLCDFFMAGGDVAPDRVLMALWTLAGVVASSLAILHLEPTAIADLPPVAEGLLYLSGLSSLGYLVGKLARKRVPPSRTAP